MRMPSLRGVANEAKLLLIGIPVLFWTLLPIYHMVLFAISSKDSAFAGNLWPDQPTLHNFAVVFNEEHYYPAISGCSCGTPSSSARPPAS